MSAAFIIAIIVAFFGVGIIGYFVDEKSRRIESKGKIVLFNIGKACIAVALLGILQFVRTYFFNL